MTKATTSDGQQVLRPDFWATSGFGLLTLEPTGQLRVTDDFLCALFHRPEMQPPPEACANEHRLHESLLETPSRLVGEQELATLADPDAIENYQIILRLRDHLIEFGTLEKAYLALLKPDAPLIAPLFIDQIAHAILRGILDNGTSAMHARAGELLFRTQRITLQDGQIMAADEETVESLAANGGLGDLGRMLAESQTPTRSVDLDILEEASSDSYWPRSDRFDTVLDLTFARPGLDALCRVMEKWIRHFLELDVRIHPVQSIRDERWRWHCGLDSAANEILNELYRGEAVAEEDLARLISLFRLTIKDETAVIPEMAGKPIYLGLAMDRSNRLRIKPQNLLANLPLAKPS